MEHVTLRALKAAEEPHLLPTSRALAILRAVSDALFPLHAAGKAYGALSPDSILIEGTTVRLADDAAYDERYAAPELLAGGDPTPASDAYAYGVLAHRLLAGEAPVFDAHGVPKDIAEQHPGFPAFAAEALTRALQPDPSKRPLPKVLDTLLQVVPANRWPSAAPRPAPAAPAAPTAPSAAREQVIAAPPTTRTPSLAPAGQAAETGTAAHHEDFLRAMAPGHPVPDIDWTHDDGSSHTDARVLIDWTSDADPTRPSSDVPEIRWSPAALHGDAPATGELPVLEPEAEPDLEPADEDPTEAEVTESAEDAVTDEADDAARDAEEPEPLASLWAEGVATYEPTDELRDGGRRRGRRSRRRPARLRALTGANLGEEKLQKVILVLVLVVLLVAGLAFALANRGGPAYDPTLHGASRNLSHVSSLRL